MRIKNLIFISLSLFLLIAPNMCYAAGEGKIWHGSIFLDHMGSHDKRNETYDSRGLFRFYFTLEKKTVDAFPYQEYYQTKKGSMLYRYSTQDSRTEYKGEPDENTSWQKLSASGKIPLKRDSVWLHINRADGVYELKVRCRYIQSAERGVEYPSKPHLSREGRTKTEEEEIVFHYEGPLGENPDFISDIKQGNAAAFYAGRGGVSGSLNSADIGREGLTINAWWSITGK